uniref:Transposase n=1 Tax=Ditylenchus dipsaci TaxID=166011 RepID=A0A915DLX4_9BILA
MNQSSIGSDSKSYARRRPGEEFNPKCTKPTVKGGGGSIIVWGAMSINWAGPIHRIEEIMNQHVYVDDVLHDVLLPYAEDKLSQDWIFQANNDLKHTAKKAKKFISDHGWRTMDWPAQSPDLRQLRCSGLTLTRKSSERSRRTLLSWRRSSKKPGGRFL